MYRARHSDVYAVQLTLEFLTCVPPRGSSLPRRRYAPRYCVAVLMREAVFHVHRVVAIIHFLSGEKRHGFFTRFCVFVAGCAKEQVGAKKK